MRAVGALLALLTLDACSSANPQSVDVDATIQYLDLEGGFWAICGDDGLTYDPIDFPPGFRKESMRVHATMVRRDDLGGIHMVGPVVSVIELIPLPCEAACPLPAAPVQITIVDLRGLPVTGASLHNVTGPAGTGGSSCSGPPTSRCEILGTSAGTYEADVVAPDMQSLHVSYRVESRTALPDECCPVYYVPEHVFAALSPSR